MSKEDRRLRFEIMIKIWIALAMTVSAVLMLVAAMAGGSWAAAWFSVCAAWFSWGTNVPTWQANDRHT